MEETKVQKNHNPGFSIYFFVWFTLIALTALTATVAGINFGKLSISIALLIAAVKSYLVLTEFMHLKFEMMAFRIFAIVSLLFFLILIVLLFSDYSFN